MIGNHNVCKLRIDVIFKKCDEYSKRSYVTNSPIPEHFLPVQSEKYKWSWPISHQQQVFDLRSKPDSHTPNNPSTKHNHSMGPAGSRQVVV